MTKKSKVFFCSQCGAEHKKWSGQCLECGEWNTVSEFKEPKGIVGARGTTSIKEYAGAKESIRKLSQVSLEETQRFSTNNSEFDRVLGGGLCSGSVVLLAGTPGAGKSTLTLQTLCEVSHQTPSIYLSAEESLNQIMSSHTT